MAAKMGPSWGRLSSGQPFSRRECAAYRRVIKLFRKQPEPFTSQTAWFWLSLLILGQQQSGHAVVCRVEGMDVDAG